MVLGGDAQVCLNLEERLRGQDVAVCPVVDAVPLLESSMAIGAACFLLVFDASQQDGFETLESLHQRFPSIPTIVLSGQAEVRTIVRAMRLGAFDFLAKPHAWEEISAAIQWALRQSCRSLCDNAVLFRERAARLTGRERAVLKLILRGRLNKQVADELGLALVTVKVHRANAMKKLGIQRAAELGRIGEFAGL